MRRASINGTAECIPITARGYDLPWNPNRLEQREDRVAPVLKEGRKTA